MTTGIDRTIEYPVWYLDKFMQSHPAIKADDFTFIGTFRSHEEVLFNFDPPLSKRLSTYIIIYQIDSSNISMPHIGGKDDVLFFTPDPYAEDIIRTDPQDVLIAVFEYASPML